MHNSLHRSDVDIALQGKAAWWHKDWQWEYSPEWMLSVYRSIWQLVPNFQWMACLSLHVQALSSQKLIFQAQLFNSVPAITGLQKHVRQILWFKRALSSLMLRLTFFLTSVYHISVQAKQSLPEVFQFPTCLTRGFEESAEVGVAFTAWRADSLVVSVLV